MQHDRSTLRYHAFSLVELSIVLVILGLLVGGVLAGQSLIRASELRAITAERDRFVAAIFTFRDKYFLLPGDLNNAFQFWGATCGTNTTTISTGCNGNGDGAIGMSVAGGTYENVLAWEHLARAGLIEGSYDGTGAVSGSNVGLSSTNIPASKLSGNYWNLGDAPAEALNFPGTTGFGSELLLSLGSLDPAYTPDSWVGTASLTLVETYGIDRKIDDGQSDNGKVRGNHDTRCADTGTDYYSLAASGAETRDQCILTFSLK